MTKLLFRVGLCVALAMGAYASADDAATSHRLRIDEPRKSMHSIGSEIRRGYPHRETPLVQLRCCFRRGVPKLMGWERA